MIVKQPPPPHELAFLQGGGEMGALMRAKDWALTALGEASGWPAALRLLICWSEAADWGSEYRFAAIAGTGLKKLPGSIRPACSAVLQPTKACLRDMMQWRPLFFDNKDEALNWLL